MRVRNFLRLTASLLLIALGVVALVYGVRVLLQFPNPLAARHSLENSNFMFGLIVFLIGLTAGLQGTLQLLGIISSKPDG